MEMEASRCRKGEWLSKDHFQWIVSRKYPDATVKKVSSSHDGHEGIDIVYVFDCLVELTTPLGTELKSYLVKTSSLGMFWNIQKACIWGLNTEVRVLTQIIPVMERILEDAALGKYEPLASALVDHEEGKLNYNVIENDCDADFRILAQNKGADLKHCLAFMRHLALFHASSMRALEEVSPDVLEIPVQPDSDAWKIRKDVMKASLRGVMDELETWEDAGEWLAKIRRLSAALPDRFADAHRRRPEERFRVLVHGAPSGERVLFRDDGDGCRVRLRGFELARVGSFADDVLHFIYRAAGDDVLQSRTDLLVEEYRRALNAALDALGLPPERRLAPADVRRELAAQRAVALDAAFHGLPHARTAGFLSFWSAGETHRVVYQCPEYTKPLRMILSLFDARGWLDEFDETPAEDQLTNSSSSQPP